MNFGIGGKLSLEQFFEKLYEIFPPTIGSTKNEPDADLIEIVYQASFPRDYAPRAGGRKENANPQFGKRKTTFDKPSVELNLLQESAAKTPSRKMGNCVPFSRR
jgi:hypothetical protein